LLNSQPRVVLSLDSLSTGSAVTVNVSYLAG
jgi:hypothetical protein